ncbi:MAG: bifunctional riboflavin kinase/FAD synthetase [Legionella sp.]|uniref:bifunctional riboflavin kinase/FAD synthetase n=1 Tax=Legionella sp. TaxID=459 RepID=UPI0039E58FB7
MKLLRGIQHFSSFAKGAVATIGNFDGVHLGHQNLLKSLRAKADALNLPLVLILFEPQPREYFQKDKAPARLSSLREKLNILRHYQIDYVYCVMFNHILAQTPAADFARHYLFSMFNVKHLLVGEDFRFGKNREGDVNLLKRLGSEYACDVQVYSNFCMKEVRISSTNIRAALQAGDLESASTYLGRPYAICGRVMHGDKRGREWGIPTANIGLRRLSLPLQGVFVVQVRLASQQIVYGVANIGKRPTIDGSKSILEVHLFDFDQSIYGELLQVMFLHKLRDEVKFSSVGALIAQIKDDIVVAKAFVNNLTTSQSGEQLWQNIKTH